MFNEIFTTALNLRRSEKEKSVEMKAVFALRDNKNYDYVSHVPV